MVGCFSFHPSHADFTLSKAFFTPSPIVSHLAAVAVARPAAPAAIRAMPRGVPTPDNARIRPSASREALAMVMTSPIGP